MSSNWQGNGRFSVHQSWNLARRQHGLAIYQHHVAADAQGRVARAMSIASEVAPARAIRVVLVSTPAACSSATARLTPAVNPKSSALTIKRPTG